jgi:bacterioferritin-associated ferredoxin
MSYRVGEKSVGCSQAAKALAQEAGVPVRFAVADRVFDEQSDAVTALTSLLEERLSEMKTVQYVAGGKCGKCPVTAKKLAKESNTELAYRVAGFDTFDKVKADEAANAVDEAMAGVLLSYKVGDAKFCCDKMAGTKVKETGKSMTFVVGDEETSCATTAKLMLAQAKARSAVEAAAALLIAGAIGQS